MDDYSEKIRLENSITVCRTGKKYVNNYADRYRAPIDFLFYMEIYVHHQYGGIAAEKWSWWHLTSLSHSSSESGFLALRKPLSLSLWAVTLSYTTSNFFLGETSCKWSHSMQDVGKEKISYVHLLHLYSEAEDSGSSHVSLSAKCPSQWDWQHWLRGTGQRAKHLQMQNGASGASTCRWICCVLTFRKQMAPTGHLYMLFLLNLNFFQFTKEIFLSCILVDVILCLNIRLNLTWKIQH